MPDPSPLPANAVPLGSMPGPLALRRPVSTAAIPLTAEGRRQLAAARGAAAQPAQVLLLLGHLRGSYDAAVLTVYVGLPPGANAAEYPHLEVGSLAPYGLRLASAGEAGRPGPGLTAFFDVTPQVAGPGAAAIGPEVSVSLLSDYPLTADSDLAIEQVSLYLVPMA